MGEIHELLVVALSLVWFAGATPDKTAGGVLLPILSSDILGQCFSRWPLLGICSLRGLSVSYWERTPHHVRLSIVEDRPFWPILTCGWFSLQTNDHRQQISASSKPTTEFAQPHLSRAKWHRSNTPKFVASHLHNTSHTGTDTPKCVPSANSVVGLALAEDHCENHFLRFLLNFWKMFGKGGHLSGIVGARNGISKNLPSQHFWRSSGEPFGVTLHFVNQRAELFRKCFGRLRIIICCWGALWVPKFALKKTIRFCKHLCFDFLCGCCLLVWGRVSGLALLKNILTAPTPMFAKKCSKYMP